MRKNTAIKNERIAIGDRIKEKYWTEMQQMHAPHVRAFLDTTQKHLQTTQKYGLQYIFFSIGWFVLHCLKELVNNGKQKLPTEQRRKSLTAIIASSEK